MKNRYSRRDDLKTLKDVSNYVNECLAEAERGAYQRQEVAGWIVGLAALDAYDAWERDCPALSMVWAAAGNAEVSDTNADLFWPDLLSGAKWLEETATAES